MPSKHTGKVPIDENIPLNAVFFCFDRLVVLFELKPIGITLTTDFSVRKGLVVSFRTGVLCQFQRVDTRLPLPSPAVRVRVSIFVLMTFFAFQSKEFAKRKLKSWLGCLHPHVIFTSYDNMSSLNILKYLDHFLLQKMK